MSNTKELYVTGMHCKSCEVLIENKLNKIDGLKDVKADLNSNKVSFRTEQSNKEIIKEINDVIKQHGYTVQEQQLKNKVDYKEFVYALLIATGISTIFVVIQNLGVTNLVNAGTLTYPVVFLIGVIASISTCMAVVGGLVLSISSTYAKSKSKGIPLTLFHIARLLSFFILGGVLGYIGTFFTLSSTFYFVISTVLFFVMVILAINLLDIFPFFNKLQLTMPKQLTSGILKTEKMKNIFTPILLGASTFFLPCGFTQSMQINAIASGSTLNGALIMLIFALGTLPVLALISFGSTKLAKSARSSLFFRASGFLVLFFAIYTFLTSLVSIGIIKPIF
ncbi:MAG: heavy metal transport/detoxification protein [candidate division WS6 bacterium GW2011_GWC1_33_20]|uniref:Heavy metal transport/detoxification protein n=1 Tax=candidate division WS6 bacterium GW2011_GWC1_33_20 TaxID=1619089 RepID=A0A0G0BYX3_9BACT|nr:MAG: heavy metal transport/detoxification protein [candidate division WS6 bacterium GW2011_GWE2_33_157]KKP44085.1 MAG: heavy metal transport/detoxification protein [candidate division WS6 bacterium GW2011_GWC1_33_20]KKP45043.1 MAG: heavy metal transport/detoxification protein [candidate division WS6 bacterium GW2011_GWF1_33_233]KKP54210.1 MAG: heavy metal transport/detoxification protein [candidate division WS6 bacterium GW2011_WS6_33_547]KKP56661.1 MAG: Heavy metal transport/detoxification 